MRDVDDRRRRSVAELADDPEQLVDLGVGQRRGRLVHDQDVGVEGQRLGDLDHLLLGDREVADPRARVELQVQRLEQLARLRVERPLVEENGSRARGSRPMKMFWATVRCGIRLSSWWIMLMPRSWAARGIGDFDLLAANADRARVRAVDAGEDLHQRRLAGAVLADQRVDLAGPEIEPGVVEGVDARERLLIPSISTSRSAT